MNDKDEWQRCEDGVQKDSSTARNLNREMSIPVFGICGWSGAGKTTLIEQLLARLTARGLAVAVVKHDAHRLEIDRRGKDTDRFSRAGATRVCAYDAEQSFERSRAGNDLETVLRRLASAEADLILVEGLKNAPIPKLWLHHPRRKETAPAGEDLLALLEAGPERTQRAETLIVQWLETKWRSREQWIGILIGGASSRMGVPKPLLSLGNGTVAGAIFEQARRVCPNVAFLGDGPLPDSLLRAAPKIPDVRAAAGPLAGVLAAMRWNRSATWTFIACDLPRMNEEFLAWLQDQRRPGVWAIFPQLVGQGRIEPLAGIYEPQMLSRLETLAQREDFALQRLWQFGKVVIACPPANLVYCLVNANTPDEWYAITGTKPAFSNRSGKVTATDGNRECRHLGTQTRR